MSGKVGLVVGRRGSGKTTVCKSLLKMVSPAARLVYDVNSEYKDLYDKPFEDFDSFTSKMMNAKNGFILCEEATIFLSTRGNNFDVRSTLVRARHNNNTIIFVFHSLRSIPRYIFDLSDILILLKTNDTANDISGKFESTTLLDAFNLLQSEQWITAPDGKKYSPKKIIELI